uniref:SCP domain-containing protein n=1 Tax=Strongyloides venezuelensis TaxID=75913 RepID=A0A0K0FQZ7_STRVS
MIFIIFTSNNLQTQANIFEKLPIFPITSHSGPIRVNEIDGKILDYPKSRSKRWSNNYIGGSFDWNGLLIRSGVFSDYDKNSIVNTHNTLRALLPSTNMRMLYWSEELAASAQRHANTCDFRHSRGRRNVGENIWASPWGNWSDAVPRWFNEVYDPSCKCQHAYKHCCGHYVQTVWADTNLVGCGFAQCRDVQGVYGRGHHYVFVCHYNPQGNLYYVTGNGGMYTIPAFKWDVNGKGRCSECPSDAPDCYNGLCYKAKPSDGNSINNENFDNITSTTGTTTTETSTTTSTTTVALDLEDEGSETTESESTTESTTTTTTSSSSFFNGRQFRKRRVRPTQSYRDLYYRRRNNNNLIKRF